MQAAERAEPSRHRSLDGFISGDIITKTKQ
jgi:hypothetical protein